MQNKILGLLLTLSLFVLGCSDGKPTLYLYTWSDYMDHDVITEFENEFNCNISITTFDSNEAAYAKLKSGATGYDIMIPSSYTIQLLVEENMLSELDHSKIPNVISNFCHKFDSQIYDTNLTYSVPYMATYTGLMYNKNKVKLEGEVSWNVLGENDMKFSMLDDIRETIGVGLFINGYSLNSENRDEIEKAAKTIIGFKKNIRKFDAESYKTEVTSGSLKLGHGYSSDAFQVIIGDDESGSRNDIGFVLPKEGFTIAFDELVILKTSKNKDLAHEFINFINKPENALKNMVYNFSPTPNSKAIEMLPEEYKKVIILDEKTISRGEVLRGFKNKDTVELYNKAWDDIRSIEK